MPAVAAAVPAITAISSAAAAGATVYSVAKGGRGGGGGGAFNQYKGLLPYQIDKKLDAEQRLSELQVNLQNRELDIATSQAEAMNSETRAGGWLKIAGAVFIGAVLFLILRKKKVIQI